MKLDAAELEIRALRAEARIRVLEEVITQQSEALKEGSKLLQKSRPPRPPIPHDKKLACASEQGWRCADPFGDCLQWKLSDGTFSVAGGLFECDHIEPYHVGFRTTGNIQCLCAACHNAKSRRDRLNAMEMEQAREAAGSQQGDQKQGGSGGGLEQGTGEGHYKVQAVCGGNVMGD